MTWVKLDDNATNHSKHLRAGPVAFAIWNAGLGYCNREHTNGVIAPDVLPYLFPSDDISKVARRRAAQKLVEVGLWEPRKEGGWVVHDYARYQEKALRENHEAACAKEAERKRIERAEKKLEKKLAETSQESSKNTKTDSSNIKRLVDVSAPSRPDPDPVPGEEKKNRVAGAPLTRAPSEVLQPPDNQQHGPDALSLSQDRKDEIRRAFGREFSRRFNAVEPLGWTQNGSPACYVIADALSALPDWQAGMTKLLDGFFSDAWCHARHFPVDHLARRASRYMESRTTAVRDVTRGVFRPQPGDFRKWAPGEYENYIDNIFGDAPKAAAE